jgi:type IV secretion system protein TrbB
MTRGRSMPLFAEAAGQIVALLNDEDVTELMCNPDGRVFVERLGCPMAEEEPVPPASIDAFLRCVASYVQAEWRDTSPSLHAAIPSLGWRIQAERPPITSGAMFTLRKHPKGLITMEDMLQQRVMTGQQHATLMDAFHAKATILFSGSTGSAKTTMVNALLHSIRLTTKRIFILEDDPELRCPADNTAALHTVDSGAGGVRVTMADLVKKALRHRPDILVIGEVRDGAALDMLKGFLTGHQGIATVHADSAAGTLLRLEQLVQEVSHDPQRRLIADAIQVIVHMERTGRGWRVTDMLRIDGLEKDGTYAIRALVHP